ncbi:hypothetical protein IGK08_001450 [Enterococcus sp. DIV1286c]|uniref:sigma factor-like helix-turn-helix DNA-binding protein n=1 Tax=Enterococcus sp. DIV1286c TaxID=2774800 RepID=UPI003F28CEF6
MNISELISDDKWEKIRFFLQSRGIELVDQLEGSFIEELYFVPGADYELIEELKQKLVFVNEAKLPKDATQIAVKDLYKVSEENEIPKETVSSEDITPDYDNKIDTTQLLKENTGLQTTSWYSKYPWQMLLGKSYKVKGVLLSFLEINNISTIKNIEMILPISRDEISSGISEEKLDSFNRYMQSKMSLLKRTTSFEEIDQVVDGLSWQNFYSKIDLNELAGSLPRSILSQSLNGLFDLFEISVGKKVAKRIGNEILWDFLIDRTEYDFPGVRQAELYQTYNSIFESLREQFIKPQSACVTKQYTISLYEPVKSLDLKVALNIFLDHNKDLVTDIFNRHGIESMNNLVSIELNFTDYSILRPFLSVLEVNYVQEFIDHIEELPTNRKQILEGRVLGDTLQTIAIELGLTRERVRQIEGKILLELLKDIDLLAQMLSKSRGFFYFSDLEKLFQEDFLSMVFVWIIDKRSNRYEYLKFADLIIDKNALSENALQKFQNIVEKKAIEIDDIVNLYHDISSKLNDNDLSFITINNFSAFLNKWLNFKITDGMYVKPGIQDVDLLAHVIEKEFIDGIKLDSQEDNPDLIEFRKQVQRSFPQIKLPANNRALTARITRSERIILRDRGVYIASSQIYIDDSLRDEILEWINNQETTLTYNEVYEKFKSRLFMESNIDNGNFLHGMLKHYYPDKFIFSRDYFTKIDGEVVTTDERIIYLLEKNGAMTEQEITKEIPGLKEYQISSIGDRNIRIFRAGIKKLDLVDHVNFCETDLVQVEQFIRYLLEKNKGYISSKYLFSELSSSTLNRIIINNPELDDVGIYHFLLKKLSDYFFFRYPHVMDKQGDIQIKNLNASSILEKLFINKSGIISRNDLEQFKMKFQWSELTIYAFLSESKQNLIRISSTEYATLEKSGVTDKTVRAIDHFFDKIDAPYYPTRGFSNFDSLPDVKFAWNLFLLEDIINKFSDHYRLIDREHNGMHYVSSIIVKNTSDLKSFEDVVVFELNKTGKNSFSLREMREYLSNRGLIADVVPQELEDGEKIKFNSRSEMFEIR